MKIRTLFKRAVLFSTILIALCLCVVLAALSAATLELSSGGVHRRLIVPLVGEAAIALPTYSGTGEHVTIPGFLDGPVVRRLDDGGWHARWFCEDRAHRAEGHGDAVEIECAGRRHRFPIAPVEAPAAVAPMPERAVVISDVEGNVRFLDSALRKLGVTDQAGAWSFGTGHLVVLGDSVDRGRDGFAVLWRLHALSAQAVSNGGAVHVVLGNHEQYVLRTNISRAHPEHLYALNQMGGYAESFAEGTVIGDWLRLQPVMLKLGDTVFVHGGVGPRVAKADLSLEMLNAASIGYWSRQPTDRGKSAALDAVLGIDGVTQYRGYLMPIEGVYPVATQEEVDAALARFDARRIVVAHTPVPSVERRYGERVYAINVNDDAAKPEVLLFDRGTPRVVDIGEPRRINAGERTRFRDFSLLVDEDRRILIAMYREAHRLSSLPHPY